MTPEQKQEFVANSKRHFEIDAMLAKGEYGSVKKGEFKGCSIGCHAHDILPDIDPSELGLLSNIHVVVSRYYDYPEWLAHLQDLLFENLPGGENRQWHVDLAEAFPVNANAQILLHEVHLAILRICYKTAGGSQEVVQAVMDLHERAAKGEQVTQAEWSAAQLAAVKAEHTTDDMIEESRASAAMCSTGWSSDQHSAECMVKDTVNGEELRREIRDAFREIRDAVLLVLRNHRAHMQVNNT